MSTEPKPIEGSVSLSSLRKQVSLLLNGLSQIDQQLGQLQKNRTATAGALQFAQQLVADEEKRIVEEEKSKSQAAPAQ